MSLLKRIERQNGTGTNSLQPASNTPTPAARPAQKADESNELKNRVQQQLINELDPKMDLQGNTARVRQQVEEIFNAIIEKEGIPMTRAERARMFEGIAADILGFGPLQELLNDPEISEIMVNGPRRIYIEKKGKVIKSPVTFMDNSHVLRVIDRIVAPLGRRIDESSPMVDARLPDGSRVNAVIPPIALCGPTLSIRKFKKDGVSIDDLIRYGSLSREMAEFLSACVRGALNVVVSGGTGSGKTTMLNALSSFIPDDERIITVENAAELQLRQEHVVPLESRPANIEGKGEISIRDLVINCLRMRPERIVVGECRGGEALEMLQAMNTGHDGSMTTLHANTPRDAIARIETMCLMSGMDLPIRAIREQIAAAVNVVVQLGRLKDGTRKTLYITEVQGMEGDVVVLSDIFIFEQQGLDERGKVIGQLKPTGIRPRFVDRFEERNIYLPPNIFGFNGLSF